MTKHRHSFHVEIPSRNQVNVVAACSCGETLSMNQIDFRLNRYERMKAVRYRKVVAYVDIDGRPSARREILYEAIRTTKGAKK